MTVSITFPSAGINRVRAFFISVKDSGVGLSNPDNLFVPFYTTNKTGSGTGLILCRQIAEQHGGYLTLQNRSDVSGCHASINLPA